MAMLLSLKLEDKVEGLVCFIGTKFQVLGFKNSIIKKDMKNCIFCEIIKGKIPKDFRFKDENIVAFDDIHPVAKVHILFVPKNHIAAFENLTDDNILSSVRNGIQKIVEQTDLVGKGYKIVLNGGGGQVINHLHFHLIGPTGLHAPIK